MEAYVGTAPLAAARPLASRLLRVTMPATPMAIKPDTPGSGTEPPWGDAVAGQDGHPGDILVGIAAWKNRTDLLSSKQICPVCAETIRYFFVGNASLIDMKMDRTHTAKSRLSDDNSDGFVPGTPEERIDLVWPLTQEVLALSGRYDAERRLQRHVASLGRREG